MWGRGQRPGAISNPGGAGGRGGADDPQRNPLSVISRTDRDFDRARVISIAGNACQMSGSGSGLRSKVLRARPPASSTSCPPPPAVRSTPARFRRAPARVISALQNLALRANSRVVKPQNGAKRAARESRSERAPIGRSDLPPPYEASPCQSSLIVCTRSSPGDARLYRTYVRIIRPCATKDVGLGARARYSCHPQRRRRRPVRRASASARRRPS